MESPRRRWTRRLAKLAVLPLLLLAIWALWDWNWFRPLVERQATKALQRDVRVAEIDVQGWRAPTLSLGGIEIGNPAGFPRAGQFLTVERLHLQFDAAALFERRLALLRIHLERPRADLFAPQGSAPNWTFPAAPTTDGEAPALTIELGRLSIAEGSIHVLHPGLRSDFHARVFTVEREGVEEPELHIEAEGRYAEQPLTARFVGGSLLALREESNPYPVALDLANGPTRLSLEGTVLDPLKLGGARLALRLAGADMAALYPLIGVPLPPTAPYRIEGRLEFVPGTPGPTLRFGDFTGTVGSTDLSGSIAVKTGGPRLDIRGELRSKRVLLADLGGFVGAAPGEASAKGATPEQKAEHARQAASPRLLPDTPINLPKLRGADFDLRYAAKRIESDGAPFDDLDAHLRIVDGVLSLRPLNFGVGGGTIQSNLLLDGTADLARVEADADFQQVDFGRVLREAGDYRGAGRIDGRVSLRSRGNSVAELAAVGNGKLRLSMAGGDLSALLINLAGLDFGNALLSAMGIPSRAQLRCMVADLDLKDGMVGTDLLLLDTTEANVVGTGTVNLKSEQLDYRIQTEPKTFNIGSVAAPINIRGPLKNPSVRPDAKSLGLRGGAAVVLGIVGTPLASLLATVQLGTGKDADCDALLKAVRGEAAKLPRAATLPEAPAAEASTTPTTPTPPAVSPATPAQ